MATEQAKRGLERALESFSSGSWIVIKDPFEEDAADVSERAVRALLAKGYSAIVILTARSFDEFLARLGGEGVPGIEGLFAVDCVTSQGKVRERRRNVAYAESPANITMISLSIGNLLAELRTSKVVVVIDALNSLMSFNSKAVFEAFIISVIRNVKARHEGGMFIFYESEKYEAEVEGIGEICDMVIEVSEGGGVRVVKGRPA